MKNYKNQDLLRHQTTKRLLQKKWRNLPKFLYYFDLTLFFMFLLAYSLNIEFYKKTSESDTELTQLTKNLAIFLAVYFLFLELIQIIFSVIYSKILVYIFSFQNWFEIFNYSLSIITLSLSKDKEYVYKSSFYSLTILTTYFIFIFKLDKFWKIGPYVDVIGNIIRKSLSLLLIVFIFLIGFLLSFRNRSESLIDNENTVIFFNGTFELSLFRIFTMGVGSLATEDMGIDSLNGENFINFVLLGSFIIAMPILLINIFTGISIDEVQSLIQNSEAENSLRKIEFVMSFENFFKNARQYKRLMFLYEIWFGLDNFFENANLFFENRSINYKNKLLKRWWKEYEDSKLNETLNEKDDSDQIEILDRKVKKISIELNQLSDRHENTLKNLDNLSKKIEKQKIDCDGLLQTILDEIKKLNSFK